MRNRTAKSFCSVYKEAIWNNLLARVSLIDDLAVTAVVLKTPALGQFRTGHKIEGESLKIQWFHEDQAQTRHENNTEINHPTRGNWRVEVTFATPEIRVIENNANFDSREFIVQ